MNALVVCAERGHGWVPSGSAEGAAGERAVRDAVGNVLRDGDSVTVVKALKVEGGPSGIKAGTKVRNIRLIDGVDGHDIDCRIEGFGAMELKSSVAKKTCPADRARKIGVSAARSTSRHRTGPPFRLRPAGLGIGLGSAAAGGDGRCADAIGAGAGRPETGSPTKAPPSGPSGPRTATSPFSTPSSCALPSRIRLSATTSSRSGATAWKSHTTRRQADGLRPSGTMPFRSYGVTACSVARVQVFMMMKVLVPSTLPVRRTALITC